MVAKSQLSCCQCPRTLSPADHWPARSVVSGTCSSPLGNDHIPLFQHHCVASRISLHPENGAVRYTLML